MVQADIFSIQQQRAQIYFTSGTMRNNMNCIDIAAARQYASHLCQAVNLCINYVNLFVGRHSSNQLLIIRHIAFNEYYFSAMCWLCINIKATQ